MPADHTRFHLQVVTPCIAPPAEVAGVLVGVIAAGADSVLLRDQAAAAHDAATLVAMVRREWPAVDDRLIVHDRLAWPSFDRCRWRHIPQATLNGNGTSAQGYDQVFGASVHSREDARHAQRLGARYVTFGHVSRTASHPGEPPRGVDALEEVVASVTIPVLAIGGITAGNMGEVLATGCAGIAVISAVFAAAEPIEATRRLRERLDASPERPRIALSLDPPEHRKEWP
jgi:thiamine-phosphate pyrophosphorylase